MRALVIGTGSIGRRHIGTLRAIEPDVRFAFIRDGATEDSLSRELDAVVFPDVAQALSWQPDVAIVATPSNRHFETLHPLIQAGIATFIEKPVVIKREHVAAIDGLIDDGALPITQVGCVLRFLPAVRLLQQWIADGSCGQIVRATFEAGQYLPDWRPGIDYRNSYSADGERGGGVIFDLIHEIDLAVMLLGDLRLLHAAACRASHLELSCEDAAILTLQAGSGTLVSINLDYVSRRPVRRIDIVGDRSSIRLDFIEKHLFQSGPGGVIRESRIGFEITDAYTREISELTEAIKSGSATSLPLEEGLRATRLAIAAREMVKGRQS